MERDSRSATLLLHLAVIVSLFFAMVPVMITDAGASTHTSLAVPSPDGVGRAPGRSRTWPTTRPGIKVVAPRVDHLHRHDDPLLSGCRAGAHLCRWREDDREHRESDEHHPHGLDGQERDHCHTLARDHQPGQGISEHHLHGALARSGSQT